MDRVKYKSSNLYYMKIDQNELNKLIWIDQFQFDPSRFTCSTSLPKINGSRREYRPLWKIQSGGGFHDASLAVSLTALTHLTFSWFFLSGFQRRTAVEGRLQREGNKEFPKVPPKSRQIKICEYHSCD